jgi:PDZ domain-containing protein
MFSLGIVDKLTPDDLTAGLTIAGTGTIDDQGNVGAIGGIAQKMRGAKRDGATIFLSPADNCTEAVANAVPGLELVKVSTLSGAVDALKTLANHGTPSLCSAH